MTQEPFLLPGPAQTMSQGIAALRTLLPGQVVLPADPEWQASRMAWSVGVDQQPVAVVDVRTAADVVAVVRLARSIGVSVTAQPVGHGATTALNGAILLRTSGLDELMIDPVRRVARLGAGVRWGALLNAAEEHSLVGLVGSSNDPSVVGLCLGGGLSWFGRAFGLSANDVLAVEAVNADGDAVRVTADGDPDLFWALRGGGGEFAIVTAIELALHAAAELTGGRLLWPIAHAGAVLERFLEITQDAPDNFSIWANLLQFPPLPEVPDPLRGGSFVSVDVTCLGPVDEVQRLLAPMRTLPTPLLDSVGPVSIGQIDTIAAEPTDPMPSRHMSLLLRRFDLDAAAALVEAVGIDSGSMLTSVQLRHLGGALARSVDGGGAVDVVEEPFQILGLGVPVTPQADIAIQADLARLKTAMARYSSGRTSFNFLHPGENRIKAHTPQTLARLRAIKAQRDPHGVIRGNFPLTARPAGEQSADQ
ncbi:FAD/FMN-containing dehydrogenase [Antricoccus suffuscus]|uniref:FAD/FMN-containing dehydrogenase n=1 Tax=Antricoccus suffuscus TaxID=1629062 RepID=A0A2T1A003_9ACTN|nr:FAD-binding oxidoreductase [Antricoccus suffuscus]PRZ41936.1 FAD/FMN-containing dehydrogenase [Antricoccus suffuscus]